MREILFRGKCKDNGEWVEGYLVKLGRESFSDPERYGICNKAIPLGGSGVCYNLRIDEVIPETIGQYTGLADKNGKKIFEGDIVNQNRNGFDTLYVAIFTDKEVGSCGCCYPSFDGIAFVFESAKGTRANIFDLYPLEVVGNIHDNKEILTGQ